MMQSQTPMMFLISGQGLSGNRRSMIGLEKVHFIKLFDKMAIWNDHISRKTTMTQLKNLIELHELAKKETERYPKTRFLFESLNQSQGRHFVGIVGPRGVGKTVLLKQIQSRVVRGSAVKSVCVACRVSKGYQRHETAEGAALFALSAPIQAV